MADTVIFKYGLQEAYDALETKDNNALYLLTDSQRIFKGSNKLASSDVVLLTEIPTAESALDNVIYVVFTDGEYILYIKNGTTMAPISTSRKETSILDVSYDTSIDGDNAIWTFTLNDGTTKTISTEKENFLSNGAIDPDTGNLILTLINGDKVEINTAEWIATSDTVKLTEDIIPVGVSVYGGIPSSGFKKGQTMTQIIKSLIQKEMDANVSQPSLSISMSGSNASIEAGTNIKPTISASFNKGSYSPGLPADTGVSLTKYTLVRTNGGTAENVVDANDIQSYSETENIQIGDGATLKYQAMCNHSSGVTPTTNMGNPSSKTAISTATDKASNTITISGFRKYFYGAVADVPATKDSAFIRGLTNSSSAAANNTSFTINIPAGTKGIYVAIADTVRDITKIEYVEDGNNNVVGTFNKVLVQVAGANGFISKGYKLYYYEPAIAFGSKATYKVTI